MGGRQAGRRCSTDMQRSWDWLDGGSMKPAERTGGSHELYIMRCFGGYELPAQ